MKKLFLILTVISSLLLCSCTGYREIERGFLVTAIGIAPQKEKINIYIEAVSSSDIADDPSKTVVLSSEGEDITTAYKNLTLQLVKPLYFEQMGAVIFESSLSEKSQDRALEFLKDIKSINLGIYIVKTDSVKSIFSNETDGILGYDIIGLIKFAEKENGIRILNQLYQIQRNKTVLPLINCDDGKIVLDAQEQ